MASSCGSCPCQITLSRPNALRDPQPFFGPGPGAKNVQLHPLTQSRRRQAMQKQRQGFAVDVLARPQKLQLRAPVIGPLTRDARPGRRRRFDHCNRSGGAEAKEQIRLFGADRQDGRCSAR
jgi:hypothetical protein